MFFFQSRPSFVITVTVSLLLCANSAPVELDLPDLRKIGMLQSQPDADRITKAKDHANKYFDAMHPVVHNPQDPLHHVILQHSFGPNYKINEIQKKVDTLKDSKVPLYIPFVRSKAISSTHSLISVKRPAETTPGHLVVHESFHDNKFSDEARALALVRAASQSLCNTREYFTAGKPGKCPHSLSENGKIYKEEQGKQVLLGGKDFNYLKATAKDMHLNAHSYVNLARLSAQAKTARLKSANAAPKNRPQGTGPVASSRASVPHASSSSHGTQQAALSKSQQKPGIPGQPQKVLRPPSPNSGRGRSRSRSPRRQATSGLLAPPRNKMSLSNIVNPNAGSYSGAGHSASGSNVRSTGRSRSVSLPPIAVLGDPPHQAAGSTPQKRRGSKDGQGPTSAKRQKL